MQQRGNVYIFSFALIVTLVASVFLSAAASVLKPYQELNARLDVLKNILSVAGYTPEEIQKMSGKQTIALFSDEFEVLILDRNNSPVERSTINHELEKIGYTDDVLNNLLAFELVDTFQSKLSLLARASKKSKDEYDPGYKLLFRHVPGKELKSYILPISGKGLWGMIYGYVALQKDLETISGVRFYKHQETPGLGGEIEKPWFTEQFEGKKILDTSGNFSSVSIAKGSASVKYEGEELTHYVDGISGATITGKSVNKFMKSDLQKFEPYFQKLRTGSDSIENTRGSTEGEAL